MESLPTALLAGQRASWGHRCGRSPHQCAPSLTTERLPQKKEPRTGCVLNRQPSTEATTAPSSPGRPLHVPSSSPGPSRPREAQPRDSPRVASSQPRTHREGGSRITPGPAQGSRVIADGQWSTAPRRPDPPDKPGSKGARERNECAPLDDERVEAAGAGETQAVQATSCSNKLDLASAARISPQSLH